MLASLRQRRDVAAAFGCVAAIVAGGIAINFMAPGTTTRVSGEISNGTWLGRSALIFAVKTSLFEPGKAPIEWVGDARIAWLSLLLSTSPWFLRCRPQWVDWKLPGPKLVSLWIAGIPLFGLLGLHTLVFLVTYGQGPAPARVMDVLYAMFIVGWMATLASIAKEPFIQPMAAFSRRLNILAGVMLPLTLMAAPNTMRALFDANVVRSYWYPAMEQRDAEMRTRVAGGEKDIQLTPITFQPRMFFWYELDPKTEDWRNQCFVEYYKGRTVWVPRGN
ncbi:MAG: DUF6056 family protein [Vicinamibacterales bacterium]